MKFINYIKNRFKGLNGSVMRYPVTAVFLGAAAVILADAIHADKDYSKLLFTFAVGAVLGMVLQAVFERFFEKLFARLILMGCGVVLTAGYYLIIKSASEVGTEIGVKTTVALAAMLIAYIWIPAIKSKIKFEDSFMAVFKAFFQTALYSAILMGGLSLIIAAVDTLIYPIGSKTYSYIADIIFVVFSPIFFLSIIPLYSGKYKTDIDENDETIKKAVHCPKFLDVLFSYIIIPLISIYTVILLVYIAMNISKDFWSNNLLEPMLITYAIAVIFTYIITSSLENKFVIIFRKIFPKALIAIVLFQIAASVININNTGVVHGKYYVIIFGIFAAASGVVMCFKEKRNGLVAAMFVLFCVISIIPPVDAFSVSRASQTNRLEAALVQNNMLADNKIKPNSSISDEDKKIIIQSVEYLYMMDYTDKIEWLSKDFEIGIDFYNTFGFNEYDLPQNTDQSISVFLEENSPIDIKGYDVLVSSFISNQDESEETVICSTENLGENYNLVKVKLSDRHEIILVNEDKNEIIKFDTNEIFSRYQSYTVDKSGISLNEATFTVENENAKAAIIIQSANMNKDSSGKYYSADFYILIKFK